MRIQRKKKRLDKDIQKQSLINQEQNPINQESQTASSFSSVDMQARLQHSRQGFNFANVSISPSANAFSPIQRKIQVGEVGDKYEQEADQVAAQVVQSINKPQTKSNSSNIQNKEQNSLRKQTDNSQELLNLQPESNFPVRSFVSTRAIQPRLEHQNNSPFGSSNNLINSARIQRRSDIDVSQLAVKPQQLQREEMGEDGDQLAMKPDTLQRDSTKGTTVSSGFEKQLKQAKSGGQPLQPQLQNKMGNAIGADFSRVRVHTDSRSDQLNQSVQAKAFTTRNHIFFKQGEYNPNSYGGQQLIAHELTHTVQQGASPSLQSKSDRGINSAPQLQHKLQLQHTDNIIQCFRLGERPFETGYDMILQHPSWHKEATAYEQRLGGYSSNNSKSQGAAAATLAKMATVMIDYFKKKGGDEIGKAFLKNDPTSAGQMGKPETAQQFKEAIGHLFSGRSNLREKMTAIYNAAYYGAGYGLNNIPTSFKAILQDIVINQKFDKAKNLGLDEQDLRKQSGFLKGKTRKFLYSLISKVKSDKSYLFNEDIFSLGNLNSQSDAPVKNLKEITLSQMPRSDRSEQEKQTGSEKKTSRDYRQMGVPLSDKERSFSNKPVTMSTQEYSSGDIRMDEIDGYPIVSGLAHDHFKNATVIDNYKIKVFKLLDEDAGTSEEIEIFYEKDEQDSYHSFEPNSQSQRQISKAIHRHLILNPRQHDLEEGVQGPELPLSWLEGAAYFKIDPNSGWFQKIHDRLGMPIVAGTSGTTTRMMKVFQWLNVGGTNWENFRMAVMGWMLTSWDHSLYEILRGSEAAGFTGENDTTANVVDMYQNITPFTQQELRTNICKSGLFPHEYLYEQMVNETDESQPQLLNPDIGVKRAISSKKDELDLLKEIETKHKQLEEEQKANQPEIDRIDERIKFLELEIKALELSKSARIFKKSKKDEPQEDHQETDQKISKIKKQILLLKIQRKALDKTEEIAKNSLEGRIKEQEKELAENKRQEEFCNSEIEKIEQQLKTADTKLQVIQEQIEFLDLEKKALNLKKSASEFYKGSKKEELEQQIPQINNEIELIEQKISEHKNQISAIDNQKVELNSKKEELTKQKKEISAKWGPTYREKNKLERASDTKARMERGGIDATTLSESISQANLTSIVTYTGGIHHFLNDVLSLPEKLARKRIKWKLVTHGKQELYGDFADLLGTFITKLETLQQETQSELNQIQFSFSLGINPDKARLKTQLNAIKKLKNELIKQKKNMTRARKKATGSLKGYQEGGQFVADIVKLSSKVIKGENIKMAADIENILAGSQKKNQNPVLSTQKYFVKINEIANNAYDELRVHVNMAVEGLNKLPGVKGKVYRGDWRAKHTSFTYRKGIIGPATISFNSLTSATYSQSIAKKFMKSKGFGTEKVLVEIELTGKGGKDISYLSKVASEEEVLLMPGTTCKYVGNRHEGDYRVMTYREV